MGVDSHAHINISTEWYFEEAVHVIIFLPIRARSSAAEHAAHNRLVVGSNPTGPIFD